MKMNLNNYQVILKSREQSQVDLLLTLLLAYLNLVMMLVLLEKFQMMILEKDTK